MIPAFLLFFALLGPRVNMPCPNDGDTSWVVEIDSNAYTIDPYVFYDCDHAMHVHQYSWASKTYECAKCGEIWTVYEQDYPCPVCGWTRDSGASDATPCYDEVDDGLSDIGAGRSSALGYSPKGARVSFDNHLIDPV